MRTQLLRCAAVLRRAAVAVVHAARRFGAAVAEMNRQQRRFTIVYTSPDTYLQHANTPPDTYREFLARTHGALLHEPSARARLAGRGVH